MTPKAGKRSALVEIAILLVAIVLTMRAHFRVSTVAGLLFMPYLLWVMFATALNIEFVRLN